MSSLSLRKWVVLWFLVLNLLLLRMLMVVYDRLIIIHIEAKFDCPDSARQIMTDTFVDWLKKRNVELEGTIDSHCLEVFCYDDELWNVDFWTC